MKVRGRGAGPTVDPGPLSPLPKARAPERKVKPSQTHRHPGAGEGQVPSELAYPASAGCNGQNDL